MAAILSAVGSVVTAVIGWMGQFLSLFTETVTTEDVEVLANPLLLLFVIIPVAGLGIGFLKRLMRL